MDISLEQFKTALKHSLNLQGNRERFTLEGIRLFNRIEMKYEQRLLAATARLSEKDIERLKNRKYGETEAVKRLLAIFDEMIDELSKALTDYSLTQLRELVLYEGMFWADRFKALAASEELAPAKLKIKEPDRRVTKGIPSSMTVLGMGLAASFLAYRRARKQRVRQQVTVAARGGQRGIVRMIDVSRNARNGGSVIGETIAGTRSWLGVLHTAATSEAQKKVVDENKALEMIYTAQTEPGKPGTDNRTTATCHGLNGKPVSQPESKGGTGGRIPPQHRGCLPGDSLVSSGGPVSSISKRWYEGDIVVMRTAAGNVLRVTPNHPVITDCGWIAANLVKVGNHVISCDPADFLASKNVDNENFVTTFDNLFQTVGKYSGVSTVSVPCSTKDFHGDGISNTKIDVINVDGPLRDNVSDVPFDQQFEELVFMAARCADIGLPSQSTFNAFFDTTNTSSRRRVSFLRNSLALFGGCSSHTRELLLASIPDVNALFDQPLCKGRGVNPEISGDSLEANPRSIFDSGFFNSDVGDLWPGQIKPVSFENAINGLISNSSYFGNLRNGFASRIKTDEVTDLSVVKFSGHVYNLHNDKEVYLAENLIVHNCRSDLYPFVRYKSLTRRQQKALTKETSMALQAGLPTPESATAAFAMLSDKEKREHLGPQRFAMLKEGKLKFPRDFIDAKRERFFTVEEIARREGLDLSEIRKIARAA